MDVVINEIAWMGTKVEGVESKNWWRYEWFELYNNTGQIISLDGWGVELYRTVLDWSLELKGSIPDQGYFLVVASDKIFPNYDLNYSNLGGKFVNSGQKVLLKDASGQIINEIDCSSGWFAGDNDTKQTMERKNSLLMSNTNNWATSLNPGGTPKSKNSVSIETPLTEPNPQAEPEPQPEPQPVTYPSGVKEEKSETGSLLKPEKELAAIGEPIRQAQGKQIYKSLYIFLVAPGIAIFSGLIILLLKRKLKIERV